ncbi:hypothetical protein MMC07_004066 [Pseudocyphellaria aurata]|nr:hypothetical protein [Pseudocyphellaria aurata]
MTRFTFSDLPAEIHGSIARQLQDGDLFHLCLTAKWVNERFWSALYCHVDLNRNRQELDLSDTVQEFDHIWDAFQRQQQFVRTLISRPEIGKLVRTLKGMLCLPTFHHLVPCKGDEHSEDDLWRAMRSVTNVQGVEIGTIGDSGFSFLTPSKQVPHFLFQSATSVTLVGQIQYDLAKSILNAINPAALKHLCLDMAVELEFGCDTRQPGQIGEDGRIVAYGAMSGLLKTLTGQCTALKILTLRRKGQIYRSLEWGDWDERAEDKSYLEWALFIRSVRLTVKELTFEQLEEITDSIAERFRIMDGRFTQFVLPTILSGNWPCLTLMDLRGVRDSRGKCGTAGLLRRIRAAHNPTVLIKVLE